MARISGVDIPRDKHISKALTYIHGIGDVTSVTILHTCKIEPSIKTKDLSEDQVLKIREVVSELVLEGDLRRQVAQNIRRLQEINSYRGNRHKRRLPARGQRTHTNARTKRGKKVAVAGKKKVTK